MFIFLVVAFFVLFPSVEENEMCDEIIYMMLDDPDHSRLHETYPIITMQLHVYLDENCETVDENNPSSVNP